MEEEVIKWNLRFPIDRWWRKKYNIPFGSPAHLGTSFLDQLFEYKEDELFKELSEEKPYVPNEGLILKKPTNISKEKLREIEEIEMKDFIDELPDEIEH